MDYVFTEMTYWHWFSIGMVLLIIELLLNSHYLLWLGLSGLVLGVLTWLFPQMGPIWQIGLFASCSLITTVAWWFLYKKHAKVDEDLMLNRRAEQYIGRILNLEEPIVNGRGKVRIGDTLWRIEGPVLPKGAKVKIIGVDSVILKGESVEDGALA